ncbi:MAG: hypothetical protein HQL26_00745 [Candidatus Omnitrophica bacterium]|nr:hypothetical protein [Candidatus Omnitrophota bacterium]
MKNAMPYLLAIVSLSLIVCDVSLAQLPALSKSQQKLLNLIRSNTSSKTKLPFSFYIQKDDKPQVYAQMGTIDSVQGIIERMIVEEGLVIYDGAVAQIVLALSGDNIDLARAEIPVQIYWKGQVGELQSIRAGNSNGQFVYDPNNTSVVSSDPAMLGRRGFIYRIINANGKYSTVDPLDGKSQQANFPTWPTIHWEDWKPIAGENAWVTMAALHIYHQKYYDEYREEYFQNFDAIELQLAQEISRAALMLQADNGGIRMAPIGTFREGDTSDPGKWWYNQISTENNLSWYGAFRMLFEITGQKEYQVAMDHLENYFTKVWNPNERYFYQGMNFTENLWKTNNDQFALDVQTWGILALGPEKIDRMFGIGSAYHMWINGKNHSGVFDQDHHLVGVGFTDEHDRISVEWTSGAIMAVRELSIYYKDTYPSWANECLEDATSMRQGIELLKTDLSKEQAGYSYSSKRGWIPFGWNSHDPKVLSLASTGWVVLVDSQFNPFFLPHKQFINK